MYTILGDRVIENTKLIFLYFLNLFESLFSPKTEHFFFNLQYSTPLSSVKGHTIYSMNKYWAGLLIGKKIIKT